MKKYLKWLRKKWHSDIVAYLDNREMSIGKRIHNDTEIFKKDVQNQHEQLEKKIVQLQSMMEQVEVQYNTLQSHIQSLSSEIVKSEKENKDLLTAHFHNLMDCNKIVIKRLDAISSNPWLNDFIYQVEIQKVFSLLQDRKSQKLFWARISFSHNRNLVPLFEYLIEDDRTGEPVDIISLVKDKRIGSNKNELILFGTTETAKQQLLLITKLGCRVDYICKEDTVNLFTHGDEPSLDNYKWLGIPVITEDDLVSQHQDADVVIGDINCQFAYEYLVDRGFPRQKIYRRHTQWEPQYLAPEIGEPVSHEVFIDGGAYDLCNTIEFIEWCHGDYDKIYAFEANKSSYDKCLNIIQMNPLLDENRIELYNAALWRKEEILSFNDQKEDASYVGENGCTVVQGQTIDALLRGNQVTFIKLDIEGAELSALMGAKETIKKWKPRLAICIYHKPEDPIEIPLYIHGLVPEYKMYIRHYSTCRDETVLYCVL